MAYKIEYSLINDSDSVNRDIKKLKCIIDKSRRTNFELSEQVLRYTDCLNLSGNQSAETLYKKIEKFLIRELDDDNLKERYIVETNNFINFCL